MENILKELSNVELRESSIKWFKSVLPILQKHNLYVEVSILETSCKDDKVVLDIKFSPKEEPIMFIGNDYVICLNNKPILDIHKFEKLKKLINDLKVIGYKLSNDDECRIVTLKLEE